MEILERLLISFGQKQQKNDGLIFQKQNGNILEKSEGYSLYRQRRTEKGGGNGMAKSKLVKVNDKIADKVVGGYKKIEETVVSGYKKIENGAVNGFTKISDSFVDEFLTKDGETVEEAKARLAAEKQEREEARAERKEK